MLLLLEVLPRGPWPTQDYFRFRGASAKLPRSFRKILYEKSYKIKSNKKHVQNHIAKVTPAYLPHTFRIPSALLPPLWCENIGFFGFRGASALLPPLWWMNIAASVELPLSFRWPSAVLPPLWRIGITFFLPRKLPHNFRLTSAPMVNLHFSFASAKLPHTFRVASAIMGEENPEAEVFEMDHIYIYIYNNIIYIYIICITSTSTSSNNRVP